MKETEIPFSEEIKKTETRIKKQLTIFFRNKEVRAVDRDKLIKWYKYFMSKWESIRSSKSDG